MKLSALGDVLHALPVLGYLREAAPEAEIDWAVESRFAPLLEGNPGLRRVVPLDLRRWKGDPFGGSTLREARGAVAGLRSQAYDAAFDLQGNGKSGVVSLLSGAPLRFGFDRAGVRESPNLLFTNRKAPSRPEDVHVTQKLLRVASGPFGGAVPATWPCPGFGVSEEEAEEARRLARESLPGASPRLAIHAGTTWNTKRMDPEFWAETARLVRVRFPALGVHLSWGTEAERGEAERIRSLVGDGASVLPRMPLRALAAFLRHCGSMLGPDTGPLHLAAAAGARTVSVYRGSSGRYAAPRWEGNEFLQAPLPCTACQIKGDKVCPKDAECRASIPPSAAAEALCRVMAGAPGAAG